MPRAEGEMVGPASRPVPYERGRRLLPALASFCATAFVALSGATAAGAQTEIAPGPPAPTTGVPTSCAIDPTQPRCPKVSKVVDTSAETFDGGGILKGKWTGYGPRVAGQDPALLPAQAAEALRRARERHADEQPAARIAKSPAAWSTRPTARTSQQLGPYCLLYGEVTSRVTYPSGNEAVRSYGVNTCREEISFQELYVTLERYQNDRWTSLNTNYVSRDGGGSISAAPQYDCNHASPYAYRTHVFGYAVLGDTGYFATEDSAQNRWVCN